MEIIIVCVVVIVVSLFLAKKGGEFLDGCDEDIHRMIKEKDNGKQN